MHPLQQQHFFLLLSFNKCAHFCPFYYPSLVHRVMDVMCYFPQNREYCSDSAGTRR